MTNFFKLGIMKSYTDWYYAFSCSILIVTIIMAGTVLLTNNNSRKTGVKEYLQHPERYSIKVVYEDSIPVDTIVEYK